ncbi:glycosyltransferase [Leptolyngbya sp. PCC 7375]|nr:glycosyltransferase [Leptolyngbya sp. PCC 7375]
MPQTSSSVLFIQGYGKDDLFTGVPPESLWGWRRNVGFLVALLNSKNISWKEKYAATLSEVDENADLFILRDSRYTLEEVNDLRTRYHGTPIISMVFNGPQYYVNRQREGEEKALFNLSSQTNTIQESLEDGLFLAEQVIVRSKVNKTLFKYLGYQEEKMVLLPHTPIWTLTKETISPIQEYYRSQNLSKQSSDAFNILFIGDNLIRKGLFRLYYALSYVNIPNVHLHVYSRTIHKYLRTPQNINMPNEVIANLQKMIVDPHIHIYSPYRNLLELLEAHQEMDLMICPSLIDCGPNVLIEGYQLGTSILASDLCGSAFDIPQDFIHSVSAPRWWKYKEDSMAFTERLALAIEKFYKSSHSKSGYNYACNRKKREENIFHLLERVYQTWEQLLNQYL